jgi:hypothetical protein
VTKQRGQGTGRSVRGRSFELAAVPLALATCLLAARGECQGTDSSTASTAAASEGADGAGCVVTFSGFQMLPDGGARLFLHLTRRPNFVVTNDQSQVTVRLNDTSVGVRNNRNPLDVSQFNVLLLRAQLVTRGSDLEWVLKLRKPSQLQPELAAAGPDGVSLQIDIPAA